MKKKSLILICAVLLTIGFLGSIWIINQPHGTWAEVVQDGTVLQRINLSESADQIMEVEYEGQINKIQIENGKIRISEADCPDHTCMNMGWLDSAAPIVCLPNHLVIQFTETSGEADTVVH